MGKFRQIKTEEDVKKKIISPWLDSLNAWKFMPVSRGMGVHGIPDFIAAVPVVITPEMVGKRVALFVAPEAKAPNKKHNASELQKLQMSKIDAAGGVTGVISCEADRAHMGARLVHLVYTKEGQ